MSDEQIEPVARFLLAVIEAAHAALAMLGVEVIDNPHSARNTSCSHQHKDDLSTFAYDRWRCLDCGYEYDSRTAEEDS